MQFSARSVLLIEKLQKGTVAAAAVEGEPVESLSDVVNLIAEFYGKFQAFLAMCKAPVPPTPPMPDTLVAVGVTEDVWHRSFVSKYAADQSVDGDGFKKSVLRRMTTEIRKSKKIKKKAAAPMALSALQTAHASTVEDIAIAAQGVVSNASHFGG